MVLTFLQNTKSSLWVWTMLERQPSCISCKLTSEVVKVQMSATWCLNVLFLLWQPDKRSRPHVPHHRKQCRTDHRAQDALFSLGYRRAGEPSSQLVLILLQHRGAERRFVLMPPHVLHVHKWSHSMSIKDVAEVLTDLHLSDCHPGGGQHRPRTPQSDQRGAPSDALTRGRNKSSGCSGLWSRLCPFAAKHILISDKTSSGSVWMMNSLHLLTRTKIFVVGRVEKIQSQRAGIHREVRTQQKNGLK